MGDVRVVASVERNQIELNQSGGVYQADSIAPLDSTDIVVTATDAAGNSEQEVVSLIVANGWLPPKTDWKNTDFFNIEDYNRIIGNLQYLKALGSSVFYGFPETGNLGDEKNYESMIYAREINAIEDFLEKINAGSYSFDIGSKTTYYANQSTPLYSEFNRIESAILLLYKTMAAHKNALPKLSFRLGSRKGIKV